MSERPTPAELVVLRALRDALAPSGSALLRPEATIDVAARCGLTRDRVVGIFYRWTRRDDWTFA